MHLLRTFMEKQKPRCQSCGMPLGKEWYGTEKEGTESTTYCMYCYQNGLFTDPDRTLEKMIEISVNHMMEELHFSRVKAQEMAHAVIPQLGRWKNESEIK